MTKAQYKLHTDGTGHAVPRKHPYCTVCEAEQKRRDRCAARRNRDAAYRDCGMVRVRGALGGTYWE